MVDFDDIKRMAPERRVDALKELIDSLNHDIKQRQAEIQTAFHLLEVAEREIDVLEEIQLPKKKESLAEKIGEKEEEKPEQLEDLLRTAPRTPEAIERVAHTPINELYSEIRNIYNRQSETGIEQADDRDRLYALQRGLEEKKKDVQEGHYTPAQNAQDLLSKAEEIVDTMYKKPGDSYKGY